MEPRILEVTQVSAAAIDWGHYRELAARVPAFLLQNLGGLVQNQLRT